MNNLVQWIDKNKGDMSIRKLAQNLEVSHTNLADIMNERRPITWSFAAIIAQKMGLDYMSAFRLAGLLKENGDASPSSVETSPFGESHNDSITHNAPVVTIGNEQ